MDGKIVRQCPNCCRTRQGYRELFQEKVARTRASREELEEEKSHLLAAVSR